MLAALLPPALPNLPLPSILLLPDAACVAPPSRRKHAKLDGAHSLSADAEFWALHDEIDRLGRGCFGSVLLARRRSTGRVVAVKVTAATGRDGDDPLREPELLRAVRHQHVCRLLEVFKTATTLFIVQEAERTDLMTHTLTMPGGVLGEPEARRHLQGLLSAVSHIHSLGVVHRDIKATNVLLSAEGEIRLADFGLAARLPDNGLLTRVCGTHDYLAPEMVRCGHGEADGYSTPVDLWGVGLLLYALLFGANPFERSTDIDTLQAILSGDFCIPSSATNSWATDLIRELLVTDPNARPTAQAALCKLWCCDVADAA